MGNHYGAASPSPQPDTRGHIFERSVEGGNRVLRCHCGHVWWPDENRPSKPCLMADEPTTAVTERLPCAEPRWAEKEITAPCAGCGHVLAVHKPVDGAHWTSGLICSVCEVVAGIAANVATAPL